MLFTSDHFNRVLLVLFLPCISSISHDHGHIHSTSIAPYGLVNNESEHQSQSSPWITRIRMAGIRNLVWSWRPDHVTKYQFDARVPIQRCGWLHLSSAYWEPLVIASYGSRLIVKMFGRTASDVLGLHFPPPRSKLLVTGVGYEHVTPHIAWWTPQQRMLS